MKKLKEIINTYRQTHRKPAKRCWQCGVDLTMDIFEDVDDFCPVCGVDLYNL